MENAIRTDEKLVNGKMFKAFISKEKIAEAVKQMADEINRDYEGKNPHFIVVLNGSFIFAADLLREVTVVCNVSFIKLSSYAGTKTTGDIKVDLDLRKGMSDEHVIIVEDIIDTGNTLEFLMEKLTYHKAKSLAVAALLLKPDAYKKPYPINYFGMEIENKFVVGYGLDYDQQGRNLASIYELIDGQM